MSIYNLVEQIDDLVQTYIDECIRVRAQDLGLDPRCGIAYVDENSGCIIVQKAYLKAFNYYGGFEYIDECDIKTLGEYTVFCSPNDRITDCLEYFENAVESDEE